MCMLQHLHLLQQAPIETLVSPVYFRFAAKHGAPPPFDADLGPPLRPSWLRSLAPLKSKTKGAPQPHRGPATAAPTAEGPLRGPQAANTFVCLITGGAEDAPVFGKYAVTLSYDLTTRV